MRYEFFCYDCETPQEVMSDRAFTPPSAPTCACGKVMDRLYNAQINTQGCKDHDHIPEQFRVPDGDRTPTRAGAERKEVSFQRHVQNRRRLVAESGGHSSFRHTHSVPADLFHGKIRETGDRNYWSDPSNLRRHSSTRVS